MWERKNEEVGEKGDIKGMIRRDKDVVMKRGVGVFL